MSYCGGTGPVTVAPVCGPPRAHTVHRCSADCGPRLGIVAVILFEAAKHLFFWLAGVTGQRSLLYSPLSSAVILLAWSYVAGAVFLFGAPIVRESGKIRPPYDGA